MFDDIKVIIKTLNTRELINCIFLLFFLILISSADFFSLGFLIYFFNSIIENNFDSKFFNILEFVNKKTLNINLIYFISIVTVISFSVKNILQIIYTIISTNFINQLKLKFSKLIFDNYLNRDLSFFFKKDTSEYIRNIDQEVDVYTSYISNKLQYFNQIISIIIISSLAFLINLKLTIILILSFFSFYFIYFKIFQNILSRISKLRIELNKTSIKILNTSFGGIREIKIYALIKKVTNQYKYIDKVKKYISVKKAVIASLPRNIIEILILGIIFFLLFFNLPENFSNANLLKRVNYLMIFLIISARLYPAISNLSKIKSFLEFTKSSIVVFKNNIKIFNKKSSSKKNFGKININNKFKIKNLSFSFDKKSKIFNNLNLEAFKNDFIFIGGKNGTGKTTLFDIISGLYKLKGNKNGYFFIDQKKIEINQLSFISYVTQEPLLFNDTIKNNILLNNTISKNELNNIIGISCLKSLLNKLPKGINTILGEGGTKLSKGNIQRVAIARALVNLYKSSPKILILDEATSAIDYLTEKKILSGIKNSKMYDIVLYTSHNPLNYKYANKKFEIKNKKLSKM